MKVLVRERAKRILSAAVVGSDLSLADAKEVGRLLVRDPGFAVELGQIIEQITDHINGATQHHAPVRAPAANRENRGSQGPGSGLDLVGAENPAANRENRG